MAKGRLSAAFLKAVGKYMLVETKLGVADLCIVFGNPHADHLAAHAAKLDHQGYFKTIVVSGNREAMQEMVNLSGQSKAPTMDWHGEVLADFGVDELVPFLKKRGAV